MPSSPRRGKPEFLILAASARFIAEAAVACGYAVSTVDGFADREVGALAECALRVPLGECGLDDKAVRAACMRLLNERELAGVVIGSGLDAHAPLIAWLSAQLPVYGNSAQIFARCGDPQQELSQWQPLGEPDSVVREGAPALLKRWDASGGGHVSFARIDACIGGASAHAGLSAYLPGTAVSHLFFAGREGVTTIGWNTQWQSRHDSSHPFCYGGAVNRSAVSDSARSAAENAAAELAQRWSLTGMNSLDYVLCGDALYLLELNPRMSATMQLYEDEAGSLFAAHLAACRGLPMPPLPASPPCAHAVLYAPEALTVPDGFEWPAGARDVPAGATHLPSGAPVCTLTAVAASVVEALDCVQDTIRTVAACLNQWTHQPQGQVITSEVSA